MTHLLRRRSGLARAATVAAAVAGLLVAGGCGSSGASTASGSATGDTLAPVQSGVVKVAAIDNYFKEADITVTAGSKVVWTNLGRNDHNIKSTEDPDIAVETSAFHPGSSATVTFSTPGTYHYYCSIHGTDAKGMVGTVQVVAP